MTAKKNDSESKNGDASNDSGAHQAVDGKHVPSERGPVNKKSDGEKAGGKGKDDKKQTSQGTAVVEPPFTGVSSPCATSSLLVTFL